MPLLFREVRLGLNSRSHALDDRTASSDGRRRGGASGSRDGSSGGESAHSRPMDLQTIVEVEEIKSAKATPTEASILTDEEELEEVVERVAGDSRDDEVADNEVEETAKAPVGAAEAEAEAGATPDGSGARAGGSSANGVRSP
eukprot:4248396-Pleurochrysis_carterae.AAC.2